MKQMLIAVPRIRFLVALEKLAKRCPRCKAKIVEGERYLHHSEGDIHERCLRVGTNKRFIGRESWQR